MIKKALKIVIFFLLAFVALAMVFVGVIDKTPVSEKATYKEMMAGLDTLHIPASAPQQTLQCGWSKVNLMPDFKTPMAGYSPKNPYENVHDSLFVRTIILSNGNATVALVSFDLLITPPMLADKLEQELKVDYPQIDYIYFSATHTHNGIGGWDDSFGGQLMTGDFDESILNHLFRSSLKSIDQAISKKQPADIKYIETDASGYVRNRLDKPSATDGKIRGLELQLKNKEKLLLFTYSAHATNIARKSKEISNDYPGALMKNLEEEFLFAQFMSGAVGSHSIDNIPGQDFEKVRNAGHILSDIIIDHETIDVKDSLKMAYSSIKVKLDDSQMRIGENLKVRDWAFENLFSPLDAQIRVLQIGNILMLGMPCDFSGELLIDDDLYHFAREHGFHLIVTSFNGDYIGYITEDSHYFTSHRSEVMTMNWVGPFHGAYFSDIVKRIIQKVDN